MNTSELIMALTQDNWNISYSMKDEKYTIQDNKTYKTLSFYIIKADKCVLESSDGLINWTHKSISDLYDHICFVAHCW